MVFGWQWWLWCLWLIAMHLPYLKVFPHGTLYGQCWNTYTLNSIELCRFYTPHLHITTPQTHNVESYVTNVPYENAGHKERDKNAECTERHCTNSPCRFGTQILLGYRLAKLLVLVRHRSFGAADALRLVGRVPNLPRDRKREREREE